MNQKRKNVYFSHPISKGTKKAPQGIGMSICWMVGSRLRLLTQCEYMRQVDEMFPFKRNFPPVSHMLRNFIIDYTVSQIERGNEK